MSAHENMEHAEHAEHAAHGGNKKIALLISVLALFLAFSETLGKSAQTTAITLNVTSNDLWAFFQAKTIRMTVLTTASEQMQIEADRATDADVNAADLESAATAAFIAAILNVIAFATRGPFHERISSAAKPLESKASLKFRHASTSNGNSAIGTFLHSSTDFTGCGKTQVAQASACGVL